MPCDQTIRRYEEEQRRALEEQRKANPVMLTTSDPFYKACQETIRKTLAQQGFQPYQINTYGAIDRVTVVDRKTLRVVYRGTMSNWASIDLGIEALHDMAMKYVPEIDPDGPIDVGTFFAHFRSNAPKEDEIKHVPLKRTYEKADKPEDGTYYFKEKVVPSDYKPAEATVEELTETAALAKQEVHKRLVANGMSDKQAKEMIESGAFKFS